MVIGVWFMIGSPAYIYIYTQLYLCLSLSLNIKCDKTNDNPAPKSRWVVYNNTPQMVIYLDLLTASVTPQHLTARCTSSVTSVANRSPSWCSPSCCNAIGKAGAVGKRCGNRRGYFPPVVVRKSWKNAG